MSDKDYKKKYRELRRAVRTYLEAMGRRLDRPPTYRHYDAAEARQRLCKLTTNTLDLGDATRVIRTDHPDECLPPGPPSLVIHERRSVD